MKRTALILMAMLLASAHLSKCEDIVLSFWSGDCFVDVEGEDELVSEGL